MSTFSTNYSIGHHETEETKKFSRRILWVKGLALVLSVVVITVHIVGGFHTILFFSSNIICIVLAVMSLVGTIVISKSQNLRKADLIMQGICAVAQMLSGILFLAEVFKFRNQFRHGISTLPFPDGRWRVQSSEAIAAGVLGIIQALLHALIFFVVWQKD